MIAASIILATILAQGPDCGNGTIDRGENCANCPADVVCLSCHSCVGVVCVPDALCACGNGVIDPGETCETCAIDVPCPDGTTCDGGRCLADCIVKVLPMDLVVVFDTSGSMADEAAELCSIIEAVELELQATGLDVTVHLFGIADLPGGLFDCLTATVNDLLGINLHLEAWGPATAALADGFPWSSTSRVIVPISDEGPFNGDPCDDPGPDRDAIELAVEAATAAGVFVSPITGTGADRCTIALAQELADRTGGTSTASSAPGGLSAAIFDLVEALTCPCTGDLNRDGVVGINDLLDLLAAWGTPGFDLDGDGTTGRLDLLILLDSWGEC